MNINYLKINYLMFYGILGNFVFLCWGVENFQHITRGDGWGSQDEVCTAPDWKWQTTHIHNSKKPPEFENCGSPMNLRIMETSRI